MREGVYGGFTAFLYLPFCQITAGVLSFDPATLNMNIVAAHIGFGRRDQAKLFGLALQEHQERKDIRKRGWAIRIHLGGKAKVLRVPGPHLWTRYANWLQGGRA